MKSFCAFDCFSAPGIWRRGNLHAHTTNSDGDASPREVTNWYDHHGCGFLVFTDHDHVTLPAAAPTEKMLVIPGIEFGYVPADMPGFFFDALGINVGKRPDFLYLNGGGGCGALRQTTAMRRISVMPGSR